MVLVRGLDRLDGSAIEGMGDELWARHAAEIQRRFEGPENTVLEHHPDTLEAMRGEGPTEFRAGCMYPGAHAGIPPKKRPRLAFGDFCAKFADGALTTSAMQLHEMQQHAAAQAAAQAEVAAPVAPTGTGDTTEELGRAWAAATHTAEQQRRLSRGAFFLCREGEPQ